MNENNPPKPSRRNILRAGAAIIASGAVLKHGTAQAQQKLAKNMVAYQDKPHASGQQCSTCAGFEPPNGCMMVDGTISPNGWCTAFTPKPS